MENQIKQKQTNINRSIVGAKVFAIIAIVLFAIWYIVTSYFTMKSTDDIFKGLIVSSDYAYTKTGDIIAKILAGLMMGCAVGIIPYAIINLVKFVKCKSEHKKNITAGIISGGIAVALFVATILLLVNMVDKTTYITSEEEMEVKKWVTNLWKVHDEVAIIFSMSLLTLIGAISIEKKWKANKTFNSYNMLIAILCMVFFIIGTALMAEGVYNKIENIDADSVSNAAISLSTFTIFTVLAGSLIFVAVAKIIVKFNWANGKDLSQNVAALVVLLIALVLAVVFFAIFADKMTGSTQDIAKEWAPKSSGEGEVVSLTYPWKKNVAFASVCEASLLFSAIAGIAFDRNKNIKVVK